ncbi:Rieske Fe-S protein [Streptomyces sp. SLBN-118]|uniref:Rieske (2Fe-2S) protein n=1 Tax=Streptomyces sp. SLBN-118 TaxID=2768454 RepID=UPI00114F289E|nr:Rieske (2Fe-2S) protein [Streptomyces sp. SLBN-118]TQK43199.1 Rieske Fe-S protein [Streptomyces sp. SLBN-118]
MTGSQGSARNMTRRTVVAAVGGAGLAAALTACGSSDDGSTSVADKPAGGAGADKATGGQGGDQSAGGTGGGGKELAKITDIPEGGGKVIGDVVVTQPKPGEFKAFSSKCTHQGCAVKQVSNGIINCPCHGSQFSAADGSVTKGPATSPLAPASISVDGGSIKLA